ncbi:hypothetical protein BS50DRAFT_397584 [Corynespora cassiicola Philippines]|uniref:GPI inositol-deacylase winged helix domain-containing protein n=1 Tax=Corynespora cassiicola Philippines TaxID=1448308 RepID=A0A2T2NL43_CORCC|nr:hypothetical protein BS50DRAFT_397584 [Corynespora cassiicola Philippines]
MVTTRYNSEILGCFDKYREFKIEAQKEDIVQYIDSRMQELPRIKNRPNLQDKVRNTIINSIDGMFLFARMYMDTLREPLTLANFKKCLSGLPRGARELNKMYDQTMRRIEQQSEERRLLARRILSWTTHATRILKIEELIEALAIEPWSLCFDDDMLIEAKDIDSLCAGLVVIGRSENHVQLVHKTAQEFFLDKNHFPGAHIDIFKTCLTFILYRSGAFQRYAEDDWFIYFRREEQAFKEFANFLIRNDGDASVDLKPFIESHFSFDEQKAIFDHFKKVELAFEYHVAALLGSEEIVRGLVKSGKNVGVCDSFGRHPIVYASLLGHLEIVRLLLRMAKERWEDNVDTATQI